jgi:Zn-dependent M28 family amino/carboxypeptidase
MLRVPTVRRGMFTTMALSAATVVLAGLPAQADPGAKTAPPADPTALARTLTNDVTVRGVNRHLIAWQRFADTSGGTRAASTPGHDRSAAYVVDKLTEAGYDVRSQPFEFRFEQTLAQQATELNPTPRTLRPLAMRFSPNTPVGGITAPLSMVPLDATPGCEAADFAGASYAGTVVLIKRGACTFAVKQQNAAAAGAIGVLVYNNVDDPDAPLGGTLGDAASAVVPTAGLSRAEGETLTADATAATVTVTVELRTLVEQRTTRNVVAETRTGRADNVVMLGAHLDSVTAGPGVNDNGTGSATLLELALQLARYPVTNKVRFAWWSAEEFGLLGSQFYVSQLTFDRQLDIALYLNFDMLGSPNFARLVYDGDNSDGVGAGPGPFGSAQIENVFETYFDGRALAHEGTDFTGRSDYGPFIAVGIPSGGLFTGAEGIKTPEQAARYGGTPGRPFDSCYHQACDNLGNVDRLVLDQNADATAWAAGIFAVDTSAVNGNSVARQLRATAARRAAATRAAATRAAATRLTATPAGAPGLAAA